MSLPNKVRMVEVGARDGLQNEPGTVSLEQKVGMINALADAGFTHIETGSFVSPKWIPQMADSADVFAGIRRKPGVTYAALTPNVKGMEGALAAQANEVAVFAAASEAFSQKNINCSIAESIERFRPVMQMAQEKQIPVRGYVSCVIGCPYEGEIDPQQVANTCKQLLDLGCYEVSLGDTIGVGTPGSTNRMLDAVMNVIPAEQLAMHCHDTYGQALANIYAALERGIAVVDSSIGGLGGCPYAKGATGNVATEDVLYMLQGLGIETGIDLDAAIQIGQSITSSLGRVNESKAGRAILAKSENA